MAPPLRGIYPRGRRAWQADRLTLPFPEYAQVRVNPHIRPGLGSGGKVIGPIAEDV